MEAAILNLSAKTGPHPKQQRVRLFEVLKIPARSLRISAMESIAIRAESQDSLFLIQFYISFILMYLAVSIKGGN